MVNKWDKENVDPFTMPPITTPNKKSSLKGGAQQTPSKTNRPVAAGQQVVSPRTQQNYYAHVNNSWKNEIYDFEKPKFRDLPDPMIEANRVANDLMNLAANSADSGVEEISRLKMEVWRGQTEMRTITRAMRTKDNMMAQEALDVKQRCGFRPASCPMTTPFPANSGLSGAMPIQKTPIGEMSKDDSQIEKFFAKENIEASPAEYSDLNSARKIDNMSQYVDKQKGDETEQTSPDEAGQTGASATEQDSPGDDDSPGEDDMNDEDFNVGPDESEQDEKQVLNDALQSSAAESPGEEEEDEEDGDSPGEEEKGNQSSAVEETENDTEAEK